MRTKAIFPLALLLSALVSSFVTPERALSQATRSRPPGPPRTARQPDQFDPPRQEERTSVSEMARRQVTRPAERQVDVTLWPEAQRSFWQDGPALLLTEAQRDELLSLDADGREQFIRTFLSQDPIPETRGNELTEAIERRRRLAAIEYMSPTDVRAQLLFLNGPPAERKPIDCGNAFRPLEIWTWKGGIDEEGKPRERKAVVFRPSPEQPFQFWIPSDSKRVLYAEEMENLLQQI
ncbi:MAG TPA: hypothetical protein VEL74_15620, partial [Thermoanaerobaculia bacterium]|nr:hypothetical protein [Thermoanaerobaculia bacterium]